MFLKIHQDVAYLPVYNQRYKLNFYYIRRHDIKMQINYQLRLPLNHLQVQEELIYHNFQNQLHQYINLNILYHSHF
ncbi:MAG: hypothetical protein K2K06_06380 [Oscillospiraceae bacterium]|nr:hypothetical protein [Oscillospiraceae bacterium]